MEKAGEYALNKFIENQQFHVIDEDKSIGLSHVPLLMIHGIDDTIYS